MKKILLTFCLLLTLACLFTACNSKAPTDPPHTHVAAHHEAKTATCTAEGNTAYWSCTDCGKYFSDEALTAEITDKASVITPATAHRDTVTHHAAVPAGCYTAGNTEYWACSLCENYFSDAAFTTVIADKDSVITPATAHTGTTTHHAATAADCYEAGNTEYWACSLCDSFFSDATCTAVISDRASVVIPATVHEGAVTHHGAVLAGCYTAGNTEYWECTHCENFFSDAACTVIIADKTTVTLAATAHKDTVIHHGASHADCYNAGNTEYWECTFCTHYFSDAACTVIINDKTAVILPATAHEGAVIYHGANAPTCTDTGNSEYWECTACTDYFADAACAVAITDKASVVLAIEPHQGNMTHTPAKEPTCGKSGYYEYWHCTHCDRYFTDAAGTSTVATPSLLFRPATGDHDYGNDFTCDVCGDVYQPYNRISKYTIDFGEYPQYMIDPAYSKALYDELCGMVTVPTDTKDNGWTSYGYYVYGNASNYMWYIDITTSQGKYRGVYFTRYRSTSPSGAGTAGASCQDEVGFNTSTIYWFEYTSLSWNVMKEEGGKALLMCQTIIDAQNFYAKQTATSNNYAESTIRAWLNDTFYNTAFNDLQKRLIVLTEVDNSAATTASTTNPNVCANTNDYIFLPSHADMLNAAYGYSTEASVQDTNRLKKCSHYAYAMGVFSTSTSSGTMFGYGSLLLRSPSASYSGNVSIVNGLGDVRTTGTVDQTSWGIAPMLWIQLI